MLNEKYPQPVAGTTHQVACTFKSTQNIAGIFYVFIVFLLLLNARFCGYYFSVK